MIDQLTDQSSKDKIEHLPLVRNVSANARHRTTDVVISSADRASSVRCGDIGGVVAVGDAGGDEPLAAAGAGEAGAAASVPDAAWSASLLAAAGSFFGVSSLSNQLAQSVINLLCILHYQLGPVSTTRVDGPS